MEYAYKTMLVLALASVSIGVTSIHGEKGKNVRDKSRKTWVQKSKKRAKKAVKWVQKNPKTAAGIGAGVVGAAALGYDVYSGGKIRDLAQSGYEKAKSWWSGTNGINTSGMSGVEAPEGTELSDYSSASFDDSSQGLYNENKKLPYVVEEGKSKMREAWQATKGWVTGAKEKLGNTWQNIKDWGSQRVDSAGIDLTGSGVSSPDDISGELYQHNAQIPGMAEEGRSLLGKSVQTVRELAEPAQERARNMWHTIGSKLPSFSQLSDEEIESFVRNQE